jgi:hypothetical protein
MGLLVSVGLTLEPKCTQAFRIIGSKWGGGEGLRGWRRVERVKIETQREKDRKRALC